MAGKTKDRRRRERRRQLKRRRETALSRLGEGYNLPENFSVVRNLGGVKISRVLLDFAEPILTDDMPFESYHGAVFFAALAWNMGIPLAADKTNVKEKLQDMLSDVSHNDGGELESMYHFLLARKKAHFSHIQRIILDVVVSDRPDEYNVQVLSLPLEPHEISSEE